MNHTPGPWRVNSFSAPTGGDDFTAECEIIGRIGNKDIILAAVLERDEQEANGVLMAAAPEMLAALKLVWEAVGEARVFGTDQNRLGWRDAVGGVLANVEKALKNCEMT